MPQAQLPIFPEGTTEITSEIAFQRKDGQVVCFNGHLPMFVHESGDLATFRFFSSQLVVNGNATQMQIARAFGVPLVTVKRYTKLYRRGGPKAFFAPPKRRQGSKLTPEVLAQGQELLDTGIEESEVAKRLGVLRGGAHPARKNRGSLLGERAGGGLERHAGKGMDGGAALRECRRLQRRRSRARLSRQAHQAPAPRHRPREALPARDDRLLDQRHGRAAILSYHKFPGDPWPEAEFRTHKVTLIQGQEVEMELAERGTCLSNGLWVREIRRRTPSGKQSSIICTDYRGDIMRMAACMFARWCQENFFRYSRQHFGLDQLAEYGCEPIPDTTRVVNPRWRALDAQVRHHNGKRIRELANFGALDLPEDPKPADIAKWEYAKAALQAAIQERDTFIEALKAQRKAVGKHIEIGNLPPEDRFLALSSERKHFVDTIKMISYRAETAMVSLAREHMKREDDARSLMRQLYTSAADLEPNSEDGTLTVRLHRLTAQVHDAVIIHLCEELTATETIFPGTELRLIFQFVGSS